MRKLLILLALTLNSNAFSVIREGVSAYKSSINITNIQLNSKESILSQYGLYYKTPNFKTYYEIRPKYELLFNSNLLRKHRCVPKTFELQTFTNFGVGQYDFINARFSSALRVQGYRENYLDSYFQGYRVFEKQGYSDIASILVKVTPFTYVLSSCKVGG